MDNSKIDVVVIGRNCVDYIAALDRFPQEDHKVPLDFHLMEGGGQGGTTACCIASIGGQAALVGKVGGDDGGAFCLERLKAFGVSTDFIETVTDGTTPIAYLFVTRGSGKRTIIYEPNRLPKIELDHNHLALLSTAKAVLLDPETTYLAGTVKQHIGPGTRVVYDCERWKVGMDAAMATVDYFIPSSLFLDDDVLALGQAEFFQKIFMLDERVKGQLIVTHGEGGAYYPFQERLYHVPAPDIKVVDTTGAGDNFHGAFAFAISRDFELPRAVRFAVAVASLSCRDFGGRKGLPDYEEALNTAEQLPVNQISQIGSPSDLVKPL